VLILLSNSVKCIFAVIWFGTVPGSYCFGAPAQRLIMGRVLAVMVVVLVVVLPVTSGETWPLVFILSVRTSHCHDPGRSIVHSVEHAVSSTSILCASVRLCLFFSLGRCKSVFQFVCLSLSSPFVACFPSCLLIYLFIYLVVC